MITINKRSTVAILVLAGLITGFFTFYLYSPSSFIWHSDTSAAEEIVPCLRRIVVVKAFLNSFFVCLLLYIFFIAKNILTKIATLILVFVLFFVVNKIVGEYQAVDYYCVWKYQTVSEDYSGDFWPENLVAIRSKIIYDLSNKREEKRIRNKIAAHIPCDLTDVNDECLNIVMDKNEDIYLRYNCLKSLGRCNQHKLDYILNSLNRNDSLYSMYFYYNK